MTARTRKWVMLSALGLLSLDLVVVAVAAPRARGWLESARGSALVRTGAIALRDLAAPGARGIGNVSAALLTRFTHRSTTVYALVLRATPSEAARQAGRAEAQQARHEARRVMIEERYIRTLATDYSASCPTSGCPVSACPTTVSCPVSACPVTGCPSSPKTPAPQGASARSSATGLPFSVLGVTIE